MVRYWLDTFAVILVGHRIHVTALYVYILETQNNKRYKALMLCFSFHSSSDRWLKLAVFLAKIVQQNIRTFYLSRVDPNARWSRFVFPLYTLSAPEFRPLTLRDIFRIYSWRITSRVLFSGQKSKNHYFTLRFSLFTKFNASLPSAAKGNPPSGYLILKKCRIFFTNVCQTWSILATSTTLKPLTSEYIYDSPAQIYGIIWRHLCLRAQFNCGSITHFPYKVWLTEAYCKVLRGVLKRKVA